MMHMLRKMQNLTHAQEAVALRTGRDVDELLQSLVDEGKTDVAIAKELGITRQSVAMWRRQWSIERKAPEPTEATA